MILSERIIALEHIFPFSTLRETELVALAEVCTPRIYDPGEHLLVEGRTVKKLIIVVNGSLKKEGQDFAEEILGIQELLFDRDAPANVEAGPDGATCLILSKGHFFRTMYELPEISMGIVSLQASGGVTG